MRSFHCFPRVIVAALALSLAGCDSGSTPTTPTDPTPPEIVTETFTGTVGQNGAVTFNFTTKAAGQVVARLTAIGPDNTIPMGISLGEWNTFACEIKLANDNAMQGSAVAGTVTGAGILCVRFYDIGKIPDPNPDAVRLTFEIVVSHP